MITIPIIVSSAITFISLVITVIQKYKADIGLITLAVEKAAADGVITKAEKKNVATVAYFEVLKPKLSGGWVVLRLVPDFAIRWLISAFIDKICKDTKAIPLKVA